MTIWFDMDGTIADLYSVDGWLEMLQNYDTTPYDVAPVMLNMSLLARYLHKVQAEGYKIGIVSWLSRTGTEVYNLEIMVSKMSWLHEHLPSVKWDTIHIIEHGTPKASVMECEDDILFDDEEGNRTNWPGMAFEPSEIIRVLKEISAS